MSAFGWITAGHRLLVAPFLRRRTPRKSRARVSVPGLESLESIDLLSGLSHAMPAISHAMKPAAHVLTHHAPR
ncbi:MAG: hypothetical protein LC745_06350, partial [Planctomycetia bacterium]|nr:hypothetical protein [Planctomycetia bacterium]